jgi:hypothetical protein
MLVTKDEVFYPGAEEGLRLTASPRASSAHRPHGDEPGHAAFYQSLKLD